MEKAGEPFSFRKDSTPMLKAKVNYLILKLVYLVINGGSKVSKYLVIWSENDLIET